MEKLIKITENDLHKIVKDCLGKILNEVKFKGKSYHGNNYKDWEKLSDIRRDVSDYYDRKEKDIVNDFHNNRYDILKYGNDRLSANRKKYHNDNIAARNMFNASNIDDDEVNNKQRFDDFMKHKKLSRNK